MAKQGDATYPTTKRTFLKVAKNNCGLDADDVDKGSHEYDHFFLDKPDQLSCVIEYDHTSWTKRMNLEIIN